MAHAQDFVDACLHLQALPDHPVALQDIDLFHTVATVKIPEQVSFGFDDTAGDLRLFANIDHLNFRELPAGTQLGWLRSGTELQLDVRDDNDRDVLARYFAVNNGRLLAARPFMPSMFTLDKQIIRQDCLGYLMERLLPE
jgi:hypothetical protein